MTAPALKQQVAVCIGKAGQAVGQLTYVKEWAREYSALAYSNAWLSDPACFEVSPNLTLASGHQPHQATGHVDGAISLQAVNALHLMIKRLQIRFRTYQFRYN